MAIAILLLAKRGLPAAGIMMLGWLAEQMRVSGRVLIYYQSTLPCSLHDHHDCLM